MGGKIGGRAGGGGEYPASGAGGSGGGGGGGAYRHRLVQTDSLGREFVVVHAVCLDHLEENVEALQPGFEGGGGGGGGDDDEGAWMPLSWAESQLIIEELLAPAAAPRHRLRVDWRAGDVVLWDNLATQHSVTPTDAYSRPGLRRLMTRTAMQPGPAVLA